MLKLKDYNTRSYDSGNVYPILTVAVKVNQMTDKNFFAIAEQNTAR